MIKDSYLVDQFDIPGLAANRPITCQLPSRGWFL
jgi:hypothetical protein